NSLTLAVILAILSWAGLYRTIRAEVLSLKEREFIEAAFMQNLSLSHIVFKEIAPNLMGFITVNFTLLMRASIYSQVGLVFLGILPLDQNWGVMINHAWTQGVIYSKDSILYIISPTVMICLLIISLVWIGKSLEDVFNPSLRK
ncbi:MAG TPA: ABC transporter permease subunit, partial [Clostridiaceae bacterium]|nr:ABC transporter permease subunit [Clostridiaceae bacterium]